MNKKEFPEQKDFEKKTSLTEFKNRETEQEQNSIAQESAQLFSIFSVILKNTR